MTPGSIPLTVGLATLAFVVVAVGLRWRRGATQPAVPDGGVVTGYLVSAEKPPGIVRWLVTVDHRDVGILYLVFATAAGLWGATDAMMLRTELLTPAADVWAERTYNAVFTTHGLTMLFFFATPAFFGLGNVVVPLLVGADDMAFPRVNAIAFWLLPPALALTRAGLLTEVAGKVLAVVGIHVGWLFALEPVAVGWTLYTPLSTTSANPQLTVTLLGLHLSGLATIMAAINFIVTIMAGRAPSVSWADLDIFSWAVLTTSGLVLFAFPMLGSALVMLLLDRSFGTVFYAGRPILWQHLFWFFGHPEVYILVLPAFGIVSMVLPKFAGRHLFGFKFVVYSTLAIGVLSFGVWAHHMFTTGMDPRLRSSFMAVSLAIAVPSAVKTFNWIATIWNGRVRLTAPMLFCLGSVATFIVGGVTGVFLASVPVDLVLHDTYYVVGHFHFVIVGIIVMAAFAASYYYFPLLTGRLYDRTLARAHAWLTILGVFVTFSPMLLLGVLGHPRRYAAYPPAFASGHVLASVGALVLFVGVVLWVWNMVQSIRLGPIVTDADVWDLKETGQFTNEWAWFEERLAERSPTRRPGDDD